MLSQNFNDIEKNIRTFSNALNAKDITSAYATMLVRKGHVYYPFQHNGALGFAPSKFIGFKNNSISSYQRTTRTRSGSVTTAKISRIFRQMPEEDEFLEAELSSFCTALGSEIAAYRHTFWSPSLVESVVENEKSGVDDIEDQTAENNDPEYLKRMRGIYKRDAAIRRKVVKRSKGSCEYCDQQGFRKIDGQYFVEAHHIISLSDQGPDKLTNVIALCPNHHREAHFGKRWKKMQKEFKMILQKMKV